MKKLFLASISILSVCFIILGSFNNVICYKATLIFNNQQNTSIPKNKSNEEQLFQLIIHLENNKDIQKVIIESQSPLGIFAHSYQKFKANFPILTKSQLKKMFVVGNVLSQIIDIDKIKIEKKALNSYLINQLDIIVENNNSLKEEINSMKLKSCNCDEISSRNFPVLCLILFPIYFVCSIIALIKAIFGHEVFLPIIIISYIGQFLNCSWAYSY